MTIKEMYEQKALLVKELRSLADIANDDKQEWTAEHEERSVKVNADIDALQQQIAAAERAQQLARRADDLESGMRDSRNLGREDRRGNDGDQECTDADRLLALQAWMRCNNSMELTDRHEEACRRANVRPRAPELCIRLGNYIGARPAWSRNGQPMVEERAMSVGTDSAGGYIVPPGFLAQLERTMLAFNGPRQVSRIIRTDTGNQIEIPTVDDTGNTGALLAEAGSIGSSTDPTFAQKLLDAYKYSSKPVLVSAELLEDSAFNLGDLIPSILGERLGRIQAAHFTTGTGSAQPNGVVTASSLGKTAASATAIAADELIDLVHSVNPAYRTSPSVGWMMNDGIVQVVRKLKDTTNQYLWQPGMQAGVPDRLLGYPVTINQNMQATVATATKTVLFGDFDKFVIRDTAVLRLYRLEERYRDNDQTGFIAFLRSDSECLQTAAIKHLIQA